MELIDPNMCELFAQLGLDSRPEAVAAFIEAHSPIPAHIPLHKAEFWSPSQAELLYRAIAEDAEWAGVVEHLDARMR